MEQNRRRLKEQSKEELKEETTVVTLKKCRMLYNDKDLKGTLSITNL